MPFSTPELSEYLGQPLEFVKIEHGDTVYRYTSADQDLVISGTANADGTYLRHALVISEPEQTNDLSAIALTLKMDRNIALVQAFNAAPPQEDIDVTIYRKHESDSEVVAFWVGSILAIKPKGERADIVCEPLIARMKRLGPRWLWQPTCNNALYSPRCGVDRDDFKTIATGVTQSGRTLTATAADALDDGWLDAGLAWHVDGIGNVIQKCFIESHTGSSVKLQNPFVTFTNGDTVWLFAGCKRDQQTCRDKFANIINFLGFFTTPEENTFRSGIKRTLTGSEE
jgi:uncharacterized phage protein (TIGR02218 family)